MDLTIWKPNPELTAAIEAHREKTKAKVSKPWMNMANIIGEHLKRIAPDLAARPNLWFSGSNVWSFLYGEVPAEDADIDVFYCGPHRQVLRDGILGPEWQQARWKLMEDLGIPASERMHVPVRTGRHQDLYGMGIQALYKGRKLDVWDGGETVVETLSNYPTVSHAHCRAAFSFTDGLVVLPNEAANAGGGTPPAAQ